MILSLGAPLLREYKDRLNRLLPNRFYELYGLTEKSVTNPAGTVITIDESPTR